MKNTVVPFMISLALSAGISHAQSTDTTLAPSAEAALAAWKRKQENKDRDATTPAEATSSTTKPKKSRELPKIIVHREDETASTVIQTAPDAEFIVRDAPPRSDKDLELPWRKNPNAAVIETPKATVQSGIPGVTRPALSIVPIPNASTETPVQWQLPRSIANAAKGEEKLTDKPMQLPKGVQEALQAAKELPATKEKMTPTPVVMNNENGRKNVEANTSSDAQPKKQIALLPPPSGKSNGALKENTTLVETNAAPKSEKTSTTQVLKTSTPEVKTIAEEKTVSTAVVSIKTSDESKDTTASIKAVETSIAMDQPASALSKVTTVVLDKQEGNDATTLSTPIPLKNVMPLSSKIPFKTIKLVFIPKLSWDVCQNLVQTTTMTEQLIATGYIHGMVVLDDHQDENAIPFMSKAVASRYNTPIMRWKRSDDEILNLMNDLYKTIERTPGDTTIVIVWDPSTMGTLQHTWVYGLGRAGRVTTEMVNKIRAQMPKWETTENQRWEILSMRWRDDASTILDLQSNKAKPAKTFCAK